MTDPDASRPTRAAAPPDPVRTPLTAVHEQLGAKLTTFAGWTLPLEFTGTVAEHEAVRGDVGVFDVSHLGTVLIEGPEAIATVGATFTNDPSRLSDGRSQYTLCCDQHGGIVDDLIVYRLAEDRVLAVPNAANTAAVVGALRASAEDREATVTDASTEWAILAVQGPRSLGVVGERFEAAVDATPYRGIGSIDVDGARGWLCRTGYTGEVGVELVLPAERAPSLFSWLVDRGVTPAGLGARDTLRLEMGYPLHGNDLSTETDPYEARLAWAVRLDREDGGSFRGQDALRHAQAAGPSRQLRGVRATARSIPRPGMAVTRDGARVGHITSGTFSPTLRCGIGLAYLDADREPGDRVTVDVRGRAAEFDVVDPPFVERDPRGPS